MKNTRDKIKPLIYFIFFILFSIFVISACSQFYLTEARIQKIVNQRLPEEIKLQIKFKKAQLSFSGSLSPMFAIKFTNLDVDYDQCDELYKVKTPYVLIPFSFIKAFEGTLKMGYIKTGFVEALVSPSNSVCSDGETKNVDIKEKISQIKSEKSYDKMFKRLEGVFKNIRGFRILELSYVENKMTGQKSYKSKNIKISFTRKNKSIQIYNEFDFKPSNINDSSSVLSLGINLKIQSVISKSKGLSVLASARHLEGVFEIKSSPQKNLNNYFLDMKVNDLPLTFLNQVGGLSFLSQINAHRVWHNSHATINLKNYLGYKDSAIIVKVIKLEVFGPVLKAYASNFKIQAAPYFKILNEIHWRLDNLDLNGLVPTDRLSKARGVVDQFGLLKGTGIIDTEAKMFFEGLILNTSFVFSLNGKKAKQMIDESNIIINFDYPNLNLQLENILLQEGSFDGEIKGQLTLNEGVDWNFDVKSEQLSISPQVQSLFELEQSAFEKLKLSLVGQNRTLKTLSFSSEVQSLKTKWGDFKGSKYNLDYFPEQKLYEFVLNSDEFLLNSKFLKIDLPYPAQVLKNFKTQLKLSERDKSFSLISQTFDQPRVYLFAEGVDFNKEFLAQLELGQSKFVLEGQINSGFKIKSVE